MIKYEAGTISEEEYNEALELSFASYKEKFDEIFNRCEENNVNDIKASLDELKKNNPAAVKEKYFEKLMTNHEREIGAGTTLWGIHKDDIRIDLNGKQARTFASQGQQRSVALAMKLAEGEVCRTVCGEIPVFLLDDVFSELDRNRRSYLSEKIRDRQVIMTTCEPDVKAGKQFRVKGGEYVEV